MQILDFDELPSALHPQVAAMRWLDREAPQDVAFVRRLRREGFPATDYFGVYAVEGGELLSRVETLALPWRGGGETRTVLGISDVLTRPDAGGRGLARRLLVELHRREAALGRPWSFLWTRRSWGAHRLYEKLGYRDVYSAPSSLRKIPSTVRRRLPPGVSWRKAKVRDFARLEQILSAATRDRFGFVPRWPGSFRLKHRLGWRPASSYRMLMKSGRAVGYANLTTELTTVEAHEVVVEDPADSGAMIAAIEREAAGQWLAFGSTSFGWDHRAELSSRGYAVYPLSHLTLMARPLHRMARGARSASEVAADPRFVCHRGDQF
ncbi:MAG: GNAT family N-acetyltransferase [Thermoplasmata archaeon]|nr:GNAT family N-acetyltransferase [Thermoplasmata archaeon]